jgi:hypothetical protein
MMDVALKSPARTLTPYLAPLGLLLVAVVSLAPLLFEQRPLALIARHSSDLTQTAMKILAVVLLCIPLAVRDWVDRRTEPYAAYLTSLFLIVAGMMTAFHAYEVESSPTKAQWQEKLYLQILNCDTDAQGRLNIPHQFRLLPYGFTRSLERLTGDWWFSCMIYRWFFTFWFLWSAHRFARLFLRSAPALLTLAPLVVLYPLSIAYYWGQLTDPLSHALFMLALIYVIQDRWLLLAAALALGVLAKETVLLLTISYYACYWRQGQVALLKTTALSAACVAAFFAARLPIGWRMGYGAINGTDGLMIASNLGLDLGPRFPQYTAAADLTMNYIHPLLFIGSFLPFIVWGWRRIDPRLRAICLTLVPLLLLSNLCFGWLYESRNYMPLAPLLATMAGQALSMTESRKRQTA